VSKIVKRSYRVTAFEAALNSSRFDEVAARAGLAIPRASTAAGIQRDMIASVSDVTFIEKVSKSNAVANACVGAAKSSCQPCDRDCRGRRPFRGTADRPLKRREPNPR
jgi:hypothetical protein